jgi:hypothetical protein
MTSRVTKGCGGGLAKYKYRAVGYVENGNASVPPMSMNNVAYTL